jgi:hypothetical protein
MRSQPDEGFGKLAVDRGGKLVEAGARLLVLKAGR